VGDVVELAGFSAGPAVNDGAELPTVTEVVTVSAWTSNILIENMRTVPIKRVIKAPR
jgi:hypothetical protein